MQLLPMDAPAELHRWVGDDTARPGATGDVVVAKGPLVIMAHGLLSIDPAERSACWISSPIGDLSAEEAREVLRHWSENPPH